jgi:glucuronate isomerase
MTTAASAGSQPLVLHPDRLFPADPSQRQVARELYLPVANAPIFSPHGHVDPGLLVANEPFDDPTSLLLSPDHYVTRVLHALGVGLDVLGAGFRVPGFDPRVAWRELCTHWGAFLGIPSRFWLEAELGQIFGVTEQPSEATADAIYDQIAAQLALPGFTPRALFDRFDIELLATTDDPASDLAVHRILAAEHLVGGTVVPTFRPDRYLDPLGAGWTHSVERIGELTGVDASTFGGYLDGLRSRRRYFIQHGATATDCGVIDSGSAPLDFADVTRLHSQALLGRLSEPEATAYRHNMLFEMARMSTEDGLVMQLHPGVLRNHHGPTLRRFGPDTGHDLPTLTRFSAGLRPLLEQFGTDPHLRLVLFSVDETAFARDIAPLAGFYPSVYVGAPWWYLDAPDSIARFRSEVTESAGFYKTAGFVDDTRALCSIPARHDMSRRADASFLSRYVVEHRISETDAHTVMHDLVSVLPQRVFARTRD